MTLRSPDRGEYWKRMTIVFLLVLSVYAIIVSETGGGATFKIWRPERMRIALGAFIVLGIAAYELRTKAPADGDSEDAEAPLAPASEPASQKAEVETSQVAAGAGPVPARTPEKPCEPKRQGKPAIVAPPLKPVMEPVSGTGEAEYAQARQIPHREVPDYSQTDDNRYLELLGRSAACGYAPALAKLGEYASRRGAWVEAYYWTWLARRAGKRDLDQVLRRIRLSWATEGYSSERGNVHRLFSSEDGSVGRALLDIDSGRDVSLARKYLQENRPDLLADKSRGTEIVV